MSFILDALKKSESERQRQAGPGLMEVRIAPPRSRLPLWAMLVGALLLLNVVVLGTVLLWRDRTVQQGAVSAPAAAVASATAPEPQARLVAPPLTPAPFRNAELELDANLTPPANPADYAPAVPADTTPPPVRELPEETSLPSRDDLLAAGTPLPALHLALHVYSPQPSGRYVLINNSRLREGDALPDGMRVERITESGVLLSWRGQRFRLKQGD